MIIHINNHTTENQTKGKVFTAPKENDIHQIGEDDLMTVQFLSRKLDNDNIFKVLEQGKKVSIQCLVKILRIKVRQRHL